MKFEGPYAGDSDQTCGRLPFLRVTQKAGGKVAAYPREPGVTQAALSPEMAKMLAGLTVKCWSKQLKEFQLEKMSACWWYVTRLSHMIYLLGKANASPIKAESKKRGKRTSLGFARRG